MDCLTQHYDNSRTGWNRAETLLTPASVRNLKQKFTLPVDGQAYAQPLYVAADLQSPPILRRNLLFVATEANSVYAFDADTGAQVWRTSLNVGSEVPVPARDAQPAPADTNINPVIGVTSTPVIDKARGELYVVAKTKQPAVPPFALGYHWRLWVLDIHTGTELRKTEIQGTVAGSGSGQVPPGSGHIPFNPLRHLNRSGLLLDKGQVFIAFSSHSDVTPYQGWVFSYDALTLNPTGLFNASPDTVPGQGGSLNDPGSGAGIWQGGMGLATDSAAIYFLTGNGPNNADSGGRCYGDSLVKLGFPANGALPVAGHMTPSNYAYLSNADEDLGSGGVLVLPTQTGIYSRILVMCGKLAVIYLIDRLSMRVLQTLRAGRVTNTQGGIWGGPAYYASPSGQFVYYAFADDPLRAFRLAYGKLKMAAIGGAYNQSAEIFGDAGATPVVSSNGSNAGTGVVWAIQRGPNLRLLAYPAEDLTQTLANLPAGVWNNPHGAPMFEPTVANGKVYVGSENAVTVFGL